MSALGSRFPRSVFVLLSALFVATGCRDDATGPSAGTPTPDEAPAAPSAPSAPSGDDVVTQSSAPAAAAVARGKGQVIPGKYIVVLREEVGDVPGVADELARGHGAKLRSHFGPPLGASIRSLVKPPKGFVVSDLSEERAAALARHPKVSYVEPDQIPTTDAIQSLPTGHPWGLDRIDQRVGLSRTYTYTATGAGVNVYILDTGLQTGHADFGGRARIAYDAFGGNGYDCNGHGTHVAGTVGGKLYGVAKQARLYGVKVLGCGVESYENVIRGLAYVYYYGASPAVVNMSLGGGYSRVVNDWVAALTSSKVFVAVAAGNDNANACNVSPASAPTAFTTAGSGGIYVDDRYSWSNWGSCVDGYAPATQIMSARRGGGSVAKTGTSMASPHVAGLAALIKQRYGNQSAAWITSTIKSWATRSAIRGNPTGTANLLLFKGTL